MDEVRVWRGSLSSPCLWKVSKARKRVPTIQAPFAQNCTHWWPPHCTYAEGEMVSQKSVWGDSKSVTLLAFGKKVHSNHHLTRTSKAPIKVWCIEIVMMHNEIVFYPTYETFSVYTYNLHHVVMHHMRQLTSFLFCIILLCCSFLCLVVTYYYELLVPVAFIYWTLSHHNQVRLLISYYFKKRNIPLPAQLKQ